MIDSAQLAVRRVAVRMTEWSQLRPESGSDGAVLHGLFLPTDPETRSRLDNLDRLGVVSITQRIDGVAIETGSFIGRIAVGPLQLTIAPKISWSRWLTLVSYALRLRGVVRSDSTTMDLGPATLEDILIVELLAEARELIARGLHREYVRHREPLSSPRGRLDVGRIVRQGGLRDATIPSRFTRRSDDSPLNRALLAGLRLASRRASDRALRSDAYRLASDLARTVGDLPITMDLLKLGMRALDRRTRRYEAALRLIRVLFDGLSISLEDDPNGRRLPLPGFALDMNRIWQQLLGRIFSEWAEGVEVREEYTLRSIFQRNHVFPPRGGLPRPRPDFAVFVDGRLLGFLDAKYRDIWNLGLPREMLYQLSLYALAQGRGVAAILYPAPGRDAVEQRIDINDPLTLGSRGSVALRPVPLDAIERLIRAPASELRSQHRRVLARSLLGIT